MMMGTAPVYQYAIPRAKLIIPKVTINGATLTFSIKEGTGEGQYGNFSIDPDTGEWHFTRTQDISFLKSGESVTETFTAIVRDEHGAQSEQVVTLVITGDNDPPAVDDVTLSMTDQDIYDNGTATGQVIASDPNGDPIASYDLVPGSIEAFLDGKPVDIEDYGDLTLDPGTGVWTFTPDDREDMLALSR